MKLQVKSPVRQALQALNTQQREVIVLRYGLTGEKGQTLQEIADEHSLTRERIRQVQKIALQRLQEDACVQHLTGVLGDLEVALRSCGGSANEAALCRSCGVTDVAGENHIRLLLTVGEQFRISEETDLMEKYWYLTDEDKKSTDTVVALVHRNLAKNPDAVVSGERMNALFQEALRDCPGSPVASNSMVLSKKVGVNFCDEWGVCEHPEISLSRLAGYIRIVLRNAGEPLHFGEIAKRVADAKKQHCNAGSCHNELVRCDEFILVGRGVYVLEGMGFTRGTICDVIVEGMKEHGPMSRDEVLEYVKHKRRVKPESIALALYRRDTFARDSKTGKYFYIKQ